MLFHYTQKDSEGTFSYYAVSEREFNQLLPKGYDVIVKRKSDNAILKNGIFNNELGKKALFKKMKEGRGGSRSKSDLNLAQNENQNSTVPLESRMGYDLKVGTKDSIIINNNIENKLDEANKVCQPDLSNDLNIKKEEEVKTVNKLEESKKYIIPKDTNLVEKWFTDLFYEAVKNIPTNDLIKTDYYYESARCKLFLDYWLMPVAKGKKMLYRIQTEKSNVFSFPHRMTTWLNHSIEYNQYKYEPKSIQANPQPKLNNGDRMPNSKELQSFEDFRLALYQKYNGLKTTNETMKLVSINESENKANVKIADCLIPLFKEVSSANVNPIFDLYFRQVITLKKY
jgi:hypothetical protein